MLRSSIVFLLSLLLHLSSFAQIDARMFQFPDVSGTQIAFAYGGDIWVAPLQGGVANRLSTPAGLEAFPRFSPDGSKIAFSGNYDGNVDIYVMPAKGGVPKRLTFHDHNDRIMGWHPDGKHILFASGRESERQRYSQFYQISTQGGMAKKLVVPYGEFAALHVDGKTLAYTDKSRSFRTWKRYQGGMAPDMRMFDLENMESSNISESVANEEHPMWHGDVLYYLSDKGPEQRFNIWKYDMHTSKHTQVTALKDYDIHFPSIGPNHIIYEAGGELYLLNLLSEQPKRIEIQVVTDQASLLPRKEDLNGRVQNISISHDGQRAVAESRGEIFSVPAEKGFVKNLTQSSGAAERYPSWSPDGKWIAYWSDQTGEYQLTLRSTSNPREEKTLTNFSSGYRYQIYWSPDSRKLAFIDQTMTISVYDLDTDQLHEVDHGYWLFHGGLHNFDVHWSPDSRWIVYDKGMDNRLNALFLYDTEEQELHQVTSSYYDNNNPCFDPEGKYLFFITERNFDPEYSPLDNTWIYTNTSLLAAVPLTDEIASPLSPENDTVSVKEEKETEDEEDEDKGEPEDTTAEGEETEDDNTAEKETEDEEADETIIAIEGFESRTVLLDINPGNYFQLSCTEGKILFRSRMPGDPKTPLKYYALEERKVKTIMDDVDFYQLTADGKKILVRKGNDFGVIDVKESQKIEEKLPLGEMSMSVVPKEEWKQIFNDVWRFERDYFYDKNLHGVDWDAMKERYGSLIDHAITRWDVNYIIGELIGELNASHTYRGGGDTQEAEEVNVGYLGVDWAMEGGFYKVKHIVRGAKWDAEMRSPLDEPGVPIKEGHYILAVNGMPLDIDKEPYASFTGLAGKTVEITYNDTLSWDNSKTAVVKLLSSETRLRHLAWIERNRQVVDKMSDGKIGYVYVRSTGRDGQNELYRQFRAQFHKEGLIIDERFNSGGQIPDRFVELLDRKPLAYWSVRDGKDWQWPPVAHFGPKAMLINGWSGSGGDAFPDYFRKAGLGPLIGTRTWGGLIGISGAPSLIDGGGVTVPTFRMYHPDGTWFKEGHGVDPDIEVPEDPSSLAKGEDPQLLRAIEEVKKALKDPKYKKPKSPGKEDRT